MSGGQTTVTEESVPPHRRIRPEQWILFCAGAILVLSGCLHGLVWLADGSSWSGAVSWRKPILFGLSAGATLISLGWVVGKLPRRRTDVVQMGLLGGAMLIEVGLITWQTWRGVASHFNRATPFDETVLLGIEGLIVLVTLLIADLTWRCWQPLPTTRDMALAIRGGMGLLVLACLFGFILVAYGNARVARGQPPELFGRAGVMKFPHGMPLHTIQQLPILAWVLRRAHVSETRRWQAVWAVLLAILLLTLYSLLQTFTGRARFELWWGSAIPLLLASGLMLLPVFAVAETWFYGGSKPIDGGKRRP